MASPVRRLLVLALSVFAVVSGQAQTPRVYLKFDGTVTDSSTAGLITSVTANGFSPTYTTDRNGVANKALSVAGSQSLQLLASTLPNNSNQALGLRNAGGTNTSFTLTAWILVNSVTSQGYQTVFGNMLTVPATTTEPGTLHAGLNTNTAKAHFGFNNANDVTGATADVVISKWFHLAFVYNASDTSQRIYINGVPEVVRTGAADTLRATDLYIGNWGVATDASNDFRGALDDVAVYNAALSGGQIQALYNGVDPNALPATYSGPKLPGFAGTTGMWGVREIKNYPNISYSTLVNIDRIYNTYAVTPGGTAVDYLVPVINMTDDENPGSLGVIGSEGDFGTNTGVDDSNFSLLAKGTVRIPVEDDYTFGSTSDDGARLRILKAQFISSTRIDAGNVANPAHQGDTLFHPNAAGGSAMLGVVHLTPGDYNVEFTYWEGSGSSGVEVIAARGAKTVIDQTFQLVGNTAAGGLELVRDPDTLPQIQAFTVNAGSSLFVQSGSPATFTLAWQTNTIPASVTITPNPSTGTGSLTVAQSGSQSFNSPGATTTYTLTATNGADVTTKAVTVYVNSPPAITSFTASDLTVTAGTAVTLNWTVDGATTLVLSPNPGSPVTVTGTTTRVVNPTVDTTYTLQATNGAGTTPQSLIVDVGTAPVISSFTVNDPSPLYGAETFLNWSVSNASTISINQGVGAISGNTGSVSVTPVQTTTYTFSATNAYGTSTANAIVNQPVPIGVLSPGFAARRVSSTVAFPFSGQGYLQSAVSLLGGQNAGAQTTGTYTTVNFTDNADGDFTSGNSGFPGGSGDNFAVQITATLVVNTPGEYTFVVSSDDGARLRIDGVDVIADDSTHSPSTNSGRVTLTKPTATLELIYYDDKGGAEVELGWIRPNQTFQLLTIITAAAPIVRNQVLISEFMAENDGTLVDEDNESSDWIEIWNSTAAPVNLTGYYLTDDINVPNKWAFPSKTLTANQYLVVFASGKNRQNPAANLHTNFSLSNNGEYLALTKDNGVGGFTVISQFAPIFPPQYGDVSYGSSDAEGYLGYMEVSTPGQANARTVTDFVATPQFSHLRGRYAAPFSLTLTTATAGATIRYTTDGSLPTASSGNLYTGPVSISGTTCLRAAAFKPGWKPTEVETQTYLFVDDIVNQSNNTALALGFPAAAVNGQVFRYGLNVVNVTTGGGTLQSLKNALAAAPSVCLTTDIANLVNASTGIYVNPGKHGLAWERPVSMEYINAAGTSEFQIDAGVRIRGGFSRTATNPKHAFHLYFRGSLYDGDLKYRLFGTSGAAQFDQIDLRCEQNYSWGFQNDPKNALVREEWSRLTQRDMGQPYSRTGYFHLYLNGIYWGVFNFEERTEAAYGATYFGAVKENVDVVKSAGSTGSYSTEMTDGNFAAWQLLYTRAIELKNIAGTDAVAEAARTAKYLQMQGLNSDGTPNPAYPVLLDVDNLADYMLTVFYDGSWDSPVIGSGSNNWFGIRDRSGSRGFAFFAHDQEHGMDTSTTAYNRVGPWGTSGNNNWGQAMYNQRETIANGYHSKSNPHYVHELLCYSVEYRQRFADRVQKHFFNGGALTTANATGRVNAMVAQIDPIIHAEAARWGSSTLNRNAWVGAKNNVLAFMNNGVVGTPTGQTVWTNPYPGARTALVVTQLQGYQDPVGFDKPLFPPATLAAPTFSGQFGGSVTNPYSFNITNPNAAGTVYYTVSGADPRATGGAVAAGASTAASPIPVTLNSTATVRARVYNSATQQWSAMVEADYLVGTLASPTNLVISKIHYNPPGSGDLTEFIEFMNISGGPIDLTNVHFTLGLQFQFPDGYLLAAGARALAVRDQAAFTAAYPSVPAAQIAGVFTNSTSLDNGGEQLQLVNAANAIIRDFEYDNKAPWPTSPDGDGPALVLLRPETNPDPKFGENWRASSSLTGSPGAADSVSYASWATANNVISATVDDDGDGSSNFAEYARGTNPKVANTGGTVTTSVQSINVSGVVSDYLTLTFIRPLGRDDAKYEVEASTNLSAWVPAVIVGTPHYNGDGTETVTCRYPDPKLSQTKQFLQLRTTKLP